jgi:hypothetical protein
MTALAAEEARLVLDRSAAQLGRVARAEGGSAERPHPLVILRATFPVRTTGEHGARHCGL